MAIADRIATNAQDETGATLRRCTRCGVTKPADAFYRRSGTKNLLSECKLCMMQRGKEQAKRKTPRDVSTVATENDVIAVLGAMGVPAVPGKALSQKWVDVVAWGCVNIEVKTSYASDGRSFTFRMTPKQKRDGVRGDLIILICKRDTGSTYHVFRADDPVFFRGGKRRETLPYTFQAKHRKNGSRDGIPYAPLTDERMEQARRCWNLVETVRIEKSAALRAEKAYTNAVQAADVPYLRKGKSNGWQQQDKSARRLPADNLYDIGSSQVKRPL